MPQRSSRKALAKFYAVALLTYSYGVTIDRARERGSLSEQREERAQRFVTRAQNWAWEFAQGHGLNEADTASGFTLMNRATSFAGLCPF